MLVPYSAIELGSEVVQWPPFLLASKVRVHIPRSFVLLVRRSRHVKLENLWVKVVLLVNFYLSLYVGPDLSPQKSQ